MTAFARGQALASKSGAPAPESPALLSRADRLREGFRCDLALPLYDSVLARPETAAEAKPALERSRAECLFMLRRYTDAVGGLRRARRRRPERPRAALQPGARAVARGRRATRRSPRSRSSRPRRARRRCARGRSRCSRWSSRTTTRRARSAELRKVEKQKRRADARAAGALVAGLVRRCAASKPDEALPRLDLLAAGPISDVEVQRARYWRGVARAASEDPARKAEGDAQLAELAREVPLSYYGMLAGQRVGRAADRAQLRRRAAARAGVRRRCAARSCCSTAASRSSRPTRSRATPTKGRSAARRASPRRGCCTGSAIRTARCA